MARYISEDPSLIYALDPHERETAMEMLRETYAVVGSLWESTFPPSGQFGIDKYPAHKEFFDAGSWAKARCVMAANRTSKTTSGSYECSNHLTGRYPAWWEGKRFDGPVRAWCCAKLNDKLRETLQPYLLGDYKQARGYGSHVTGTGLIPLDAIDQTSIRPLHGVPGVIAEIKIRHVSGGYSTLGFKSYRQGRAAFEGTAQDFILCDEEPDNDIYSECVIRTTTTKGLIVLTFTPLDGVTDVVKRFMPEVVESGILESRPWDPVYEGERELEGRILEGPSASLAKVLMAMGRGGVEEGPRLSYGMRLTPTRYVLRIGWDMPMPHLTEEMKQAVFHEFPRHEWPARTKGIPILALGRIYPYDIDSGLKVRPFRAPDWYVRGYAVDPGWNYTGILWFAANPHTGQIWITDEYLGAVAPVAQHARVVKMRPGGDWLHGLLDPRDYGRDRADGEEILRLYQNEGLRIIRGDTHAVDAGIQTVTEMVAGGQLKFFSHMTHFEREWGLYHRDKWGKPVKEDDHLMDCLRNIACNWRQCAMTEADARESMGAVSGWMEDAVAGVADTVAGY